MTRIVCDEYRAEMIAHLIVRNALTLEMNGEKIPHQGYSPGLHIGPLAEAMGDAIDPGWYDTVQTYRNWNMPLDEMWKKS
jgi:hypothetical protein